MLHNLWVHPRCGRSRPVIYVCFAPKADNVGDTAQIRFVPKADSCTVVKDSLRVPQPSDFTRFSVFLHLLSLTSWEVSWEFLCRFCAQLRAFGSRSQRAQDRAP